MAQSSSFSKDVGVFESVTLSLLSEIEESFRPAIDKYPRIAGFWARWLSLHAGFIRRLSKIAPQGRMTEDYMEREVLRVLRIRAAFLSSAVQYFHLERGKTSDEASLLATLCTESDKVWMDAITGEVNRLRASLSKIERTRRVIGAYSVKS